jgi:RNA polymerase sigma-32 factor
MRSTHTPYSQTSHKIYDVAFKAPMLEKKHELELATRWKNNKDADALAELTNSYIRLAISIANKFKHYGLPRADLIQEGTVGLLIAAEKFEPNRDLRFSTYANWWVRATIQDYVLRNWSIVRTGTTAAHKKLFFSLRSTRAKLVCVNDETLKPASIKKIAKELGVREKDVATMENRLFTSDYSLNATITDETGIERQDNLVDSAPTPEEHVQKTHDSNVRSQLIASALKCLDKRELQIIQDRRLNEDSATLAAIGEKIGVSKERVRQLETQAMGKLKKAILNQLGTDNLADHTMLI